MTENRHRNSLHKLDKLTDLLRQGTELLIFMQDYPDPDAIAAAAALRLFVRTTSRIPCTLAHGGAIGRAENRALVKYANLNLRRVEDIDPGKFSLLAMVDTQPLTGNNSLPSEFWPQIVIDHHPIRHSTRGVMFTDIRRRYGATSTILYEYLRAVGATINVNLATTLVYGIRSDTQDLGREATKPDIDAYLSLYPIANKRMLSRIEHATVPRQYFQMISTALTQARVYGHGVISGLGELDYPDVIGEVADLLLRDEKSDTVLCYGIQGGRVLLSMRTSNSDVNAGKTIRSIVGKDGTGGGHTALAGGQIRLKTGTKAEIAEIEKRIRQRFRRAVGADSHARGAALVRKPR